MSNGNIHAPQDRCPICGHFAVEYGSRHIKNNSRVMCASDRRGDFTFSCAHCGARLIIVIALLHTTEAPAVNIWGEEKKNIILLSVKIGSKGRYHSAF